MQQADYPASAPTYLRDAHDALANADADLRIYEEGYDQAGPIPISLVVQAIDLLRHVITAEAEKYRWGDLRSIDP